MGFDLGAVLDPFSSDNPIFKGEDLGGQLFGKDVGTFMADPMDLFGHRAKGAAQEIKDILTQSAQEGIALQEQQEAFVRERYEPYYQEGVGAMGKLSALYTGEGETGYRPSKMFEYQREKGLENIKAGMSKAGVLHSSARKERDIGLVSDLASEDINRYGRGLLSQIQMGSGAAEAVGAAGSATSGRIGSLYSNLASGLNVTQQAYGQAREAAMGTAGNTLMNLSTYQAQG